MHLDIKCACRNGDLSDLEHVCQPEELGDGSGNVWRLRKALYGLKKGGTGMAQSPCRVVA